MTEKRIQIFVSGKVQGVYFRANTVHKANSLDVKGWVKNLPDSRVEILAEGNEESVNQLLVWCKKGPPGAEVDKIEIKVRPFIREFNDFQIVY